MSQQQQHFLLEESDSDGFSSNQSRNSSTQSRNKTFMFLTAVIGLTALVLGSVALAKYERLDSNVASNEAITQSSHDLTIHSAMSNADVSRSSGMISSLPLCHQSQQNWMVCQEFSSFVAKQIEQITMAQRTPAQYAQLIAAGTDYKTNQSFSFVASASGAILKTAYEKSHLESKVMPITDARNCFFVHDTRLCVFYVTDLNGTEARLVALYSPGLDLNAVATNRARRTVMGDIENFGSSLVNNWKGSWSGLGDSVGQGALSGAESGALKGAEHGAIAGAISGIAGGPAGIVGGAIAGAATGAVEGAWKGGVSGAVSGGENYLEQQGWSDLKSTVESYADDDY